MKNNGHTYMDGTHGWFRVIRAFILGGRGGLGKFT